MTASASLWIPLVVAALVSGACFVAVLTARRGAEPIMALLGLVAFGLANYTVVLIISGLGRLDVVVYALAFLVGGAVGGWMLAASLLERSAGSSERPEIDVLPADTGQVAVVVLSCVEPAEYDPRATADMLSALADEELIDPSLGALPFLYFAQKTRYRAIGGTSPATSELRALSDRLTTRLETQGVSRVDVATCVGPGRLAVRIAELFRLGFRRVIVAEATVAESLQMAEAKREVDSMRPEQHSGNITYTGALGDAEGIVEMLSARILNSNERPENLGVVLVGHGQPEPIAQRNPEFDRAETAFMHRVRMRLIDAGVAEGNVRLAWADWGSPDITSVVRHLAALGCRRVVVVPAVFPFTVIATLLDLEISVREARVDEAVSTVTLSAWRDDDAVVEELTRRIRDAL